MENEMSDQEPHLNLEIEDGEKRRLDRTNSALFTFFGAAASRNHVYFQYEDGEDLRGTYIFANAPVFKQIAGFMLQHDFIAHLNMPEVSETDEDAYQKMIDQEVQREGDFDGIPEDWTE
jgi:hypothetical protein